LRGDVHFGVPELFPKHAQMLLDHIGTKVAAQPISDPVLYEVVMRITPRNHNLLCKLAI
jgi:hypothetical protein